MTSQRVATQVESRFGTRGCDAHEVLRLSTGPKTLVNKKNRKVRRVRDLYPEVNIKVLYAAEYEKLVARLQLHDQTEKVKRFKVRAQAMGNRIGLDCDHIGDLLEQIEGPNHR